MVSLPIGTSGSPIAIWVGQDRVSLVFCGDELVYPDKAPAAAGSRPETTIPNGQWLQLVAHPVGGYAPAGSTFTVSHSWGSSGLQWIRTTRALQLWHDRPLIPNGNNQVLPERLQEFTTGKWNDTFTWTIQDQIWPGEVLSLIGNSNSTYAGPRECTINSWSFQPASTWTYQPDRRSA